MESPQGADHWRELPRTLPAAWAQLVTGLRDLKDRSCLSLAELAKVTAVSRSSWERYLNGKQFPPRHAVEALCRATQESGARILAQWEVADAVWSRRGHVSSDSANQKAAVTDAAALLHRTRSSRLVRHPRAALRVASVFVSARPKTAAAAVFLLCATMITPAAVIHASRTAARSPAGRPPVCRLQACEGRDPRTTACEDPTTLALHTAADGTRLEIRLSSSCEAGWIRAWPTHSGFQLRITGPDAHPQSAVRTIGSTEPELIATTMIAAPRPSNLRACYYPSAGQPGRECFGGAN
ncbi:helix-turn-helix domain-containing protein [Streptomyces sp. NPDC088725]|uniref:helix-turn-helix domain-containing protein n=1 Tax=Streptomyces sp. NPDC088725 TaxID=3365873 RepID=UPI0037FFB527